MKRALIATGLAAIVFSGIYGLAASLGVNSGTLGAGTAAVAACQSTAVDVSYVPTYSDTIPGYEATDVTLDGLDTALAACGDKSFKITLSDGADASLGEYTGTTPTSGTSVTVTASNVAAADVEAVHVTIYG